MPDLQAAVQALGRAVEVARGFVSADDLAAASELAATVHSRHGFLGETVVIALAGGTGSGKSSLLNALAGEEVSTVGAVRPTTAEPLAWIPANPEPGLVRLLDDMGLDRRVGHQMEIPVAIIDLPDYDSVEFDHRATVEALVPRVDAVVWVLDPQKYSDRALHRDYLVPLVSYQDQFLFVLNQVDRLDEPGLAAVLDDLEVRLQSEGFADVPIVTTAARPPGDMPAGVAALREAIGERFEAKRSVQAKLLVDVRRAADLLRHAAGLDIEADEQMEKTWAAAEKTAVDGLTELVAGAAIAERAEAIGQRTATSRAAGPVGRLAALVRLSRLGRAMGAAPDEVGAGEWWRQPGLERVLHGLSRGVTDVSTAVGSELGRRLRSDFAPEQLERDVRATVEGARNAAGELTLPAPRAWWTVAGAAQLVLFVGLVGGLVWLWVDGVDRGQIPWNLILVAGAAVAAALLGWATRASGRRAGRKAASEYRLVVAASLGAQLHERIGERLGEALRVRNRLAAELAAVVAATSQ